MTRGRRIPLREALAGLPAAGAAPLHLAVWVFFYGPEGGE